MGLFKKKQLSEEVSCAKDEMTVEKYCDELFRMRDEGKTDKEIAEWSVKYVFFVLSHRKEIEEECLRRHRLRSETLPNVE